MLVRAFAGSVARRDARFGVFAGTDRRRHSPFRPRVRGVGVAAIRSTIGVMDALTTFDGRPGPSDTLGRAMRDLRISVTDRCNFRCTYCMPKEVFGRDYAFLPRDQV